MSVPNSVEDLNPGTGLRLGRIRQEGESTGYDDNYDNAIYTTEATGLSHMEYQSYFQINENSTGGQVPDVGETVESYFAQDGAIPELPEGFEPGWNDDNDVTVAPPDNFPPSANHGFFAKWWGYDHNQTDAFNIVNAQTLSASASTEILTLPLVVEGGKLLKVTMSSTDSVTIGISYLNIKKEVTV